MIQLPKKPSGDVKDNPRKLILFANPKVGKTTICASLPNHLFLDLEGGSAFLPNAVRIDVLGEALKNGVPPARILRASTDELTKAYKDGFRYDYLIIDTGTALEDIANDVALAAYKASPMGKDWNGTLITNLPNGAGYGYQREYFMQIYNSFTPFPAKCLILLMHVKRASMTKNGENITSRDIDATGKLKTILCADADATGYLYVDKDDTSKRWVSFKSSQDDLVTGSRLERLSGQEFVISEKVDGKIVTHWDKIFV